MCEHSEYILIESNPGEYDTEIFKTCVDCGVTFARNWIFGWSELLPNGVWTRTARDEDEA